MSIDKAIPGVGGSYRYDPVTHKLVLVDYTHDPAAGAHPYEVVPEPAIPTPATIKAATVIKPIKADEPVNPPAA